MGSRGRVVLVAVIFAVIVGAPLVILFASGGGDDDPKAQPKPRSTGLRVERGPTGSDLVIYVKPAVNVPERAGGRTEVVLECVDSDGDAVMAQDEQWPFQDTDQLAVGPHAHMALDPLSITAVERCLVRGTQPLVEGPLR